jgi:hypothetical protein
MAEKEWRWKGLRSGGSAISFADGLGPLPPLRYRQPLLFYPPSPSSDIFQGIFFFPPYEESRIGIIFDSLLGNFILVPIMSTTNQA